LHLSLQSPNHQPRRRRPSRRRTRRRLATPSFPNQKLRRSSMATAFAVNGMIGAINASKTVAGRRNSSRMFSAASYSSSVMDPYKTLRIQPGATESKVRKAF
ncbi:hypothetical protein LINPERHAP1_LOCUS472, partial [Linum perenne]